MKRSVNRGRWFLLGVNTAISDLLDGLGEVVGYKDRYLKERYKEVIQAAYP